MRVAVIFMLLLAACVQVAEEINETQNATVYTITPVTVKTNKTVQNATPTLAPTPQPTIMPEANVSENVTVVEEIVELTIAQQAKMIPLLENAVKNSYCYDLTWDGIESQNTRWPLEIRKEMRFEYLGGKLFKGWIVFSLYLSNDRLASETASVLVNDLVVDCLDAKNFTINWQKALFRYSELN
jgi:hypothetical protein